MRQQIFLVEIQEARVGLFLGQITARAYHDDR
jgi:hypothetical protein